MKDICAVVMMVLATYALAGDPQTSETACHLRLVYPAHSALKNPVSVWFTLDGNSLHVVFEVRTAEINAKAHLDVNEYPFQRDVVEVFVSVSGAPTNNFPYYEFELSPYNQAFQVKVPGAKQRFQEGIQVSGFEHTVSRLAGRWVGTMTIPLNAMGWDGDTTKLVGNAYAILGKSPHRSFWSLFLPVQTRPNFHHPEFFRPLVCPQGASQP
jgi:hypothetical protein